MNYCHTSISCEDTCTQSVQCLLSECPYGIEMKEVLDARHNTFVFPCRRHVMDAAESTLQEDILARDDAPLYHVWLQKFKRYASHFLEDSGMGIVQRKNL